MAHIDRKRGVFVDRIGRETKLSDLAKVLVIRSSGGRSIGWAVEYDDLKQEVTVLLDEDSKIPNCVRTKTVPVSWVEWVPSA